MHLGAAFPTKGDVETARKQLSETARRCARACPDHVERNAEIEQHACVNG